MIEEPRLGSFDEVSGLPETRSVSVVHLSGQKRLDAPVAGGLDVDFPAVGAVPLIDVGPKPRTAARALDRRDGIEKLDGHLSIGDVRRRGDQSQRQTGRIGYQVAFAAVLAAIRGVWPRVRPPKTARTDALSTSARERSTCPSRPKALRTAR